MLRLGTRNFLQFDVAAAKKSLIYSSMDLLLCRQDGGAPRLDSSMDLSLCRQDGGAPRLDSSMDLSLCRQDGGAPRL
jgi:hypothetical protein